MYPFLTLTEISGGVPIRLHAPPTHVSGRSVKMNRYTSKSNFNIAIPGTAAVVLIIQAIAQFNKDVSCIQFTPRTNEFDYVRFKSGIGFVFELSMF